MSDELNLLKTDTIENDEKIDLNANENNDENSSTIKSTSMSKSTSYSSIKSDDNNDARIKEIFDKQIEKQRIEDELLKNVEANVAKCDLNAELEVEKKSSESDSPNKPDENLQNLDSIVAADKINENTSKNVYRYTKEFLEKIRKDRSKFIEQILPDLFRAYNYCMNGKYWNPEKYYDVVQHQFPDELDKIKKPNRKPNPNRNKHNRNYHPVQRKQFINQPAKINPTIQQTNNNNNNNNMQNETRTQADIILLNLIKNQSKSSKQTKQIQNEPSILDKLLFKLPSTSSTIKQQSTIKSDNLLDLINNKTLTKPVILTAQQLEKDSFNFAQQISHNTDDRNTDAYKRLLNLFNKEQKCENIIENLLQNSKAQNECTQNRQETVFPIINPHELPFQNNTNPLNFIFNSKLQQHQQHQTISASTSSVSSLATSTSSSTSSSPNKVIDNLFDKLKENAKKKEDLQAQQNEHFKFLLNKISRPQSPTPLTSSTPASASLLKWFLPQPQQQQQQQHFNFKLPEDPLSKC